MEGRQWIPGILELFFHLERSSPFWASPTKQGKSFRRKPNGHSLKQSLKYGLSAISYELPF
jgi:hypothetical protein